MSAYPSARVRRGPRKLTWLLILGPALAGCPGPVVRPEMPPVGPAPPVIPPPAAPPASAAPPVAREPEIPPPAQLGTPASSRAAAPAWSQLMGPEGSALPDAEGLFHSASTASDSGAESLGLVCSLDASAFHQDNPDPSGWHSAVHLVIGATGPRDQPLTVYGGQPAQRTSYFGLRVAPDAPSAAGPFTLLLSRHRNYGLKELLVSAAEVLLVLPAIAHLARGSDPNHLALESIPGVREPGGTVRFSGRWVQARCIPLGRADLEAALGQAGKPVAANLGKLAATPPRPGWRERRAVEDPRRWTRESIAAAASLVGWDDPRVQHWVRQLAATETALRQRLAQELETPVAPVGSGSFLGGRVPVQKVRSACGQKAMQAFRPFPKGLQPTRESCLLRFTLRNESLQPFRMNDLEVVSDLGALTQHELYRFGSKAPLHSAELAPGETAEFITEVKAPRDLADAPVRAPLYLGHHYDEVKVKLSDPAWQAVARGRELRVERFSCGVAADRAFMAGVSFPLRYGFERADALPCFLLFQLRATTNDPGPPFASLHLTPAQPKSGWFLELVPVVRRQAGRLERPLLSLLPGQSADFAAYLDDSFGRVKTAPAPEELFLYLRPGEQQNLIRAEELPDYSAAPPRNGASVSP